MTHKIEHHGRSELKFEARSGKGNILTLKLVKMVSADSNVGTDTFPSKAVNFMKKILAVGHS